MRTRTLSSLLAAAALFFPVFVSAAPSRTSQIKTQLATYLSQSRYIPPNVRMAPIAPGQIKIKTQVDKSHGLDGHMHIVGHEVRKVTFEAKGLAMPVKGKATANTLFMGSKPTTVSNIKVLVPKDWGQAPKTK